jgi:hypothetical protein
MNRLLLGMMILGGAAVLGGCPVYPDQRSYQVCGECCTSADCGPGYACTSDGQCFAENAVDASASGGDCGTCPAGTVCTLSGGTLQCLAPGATELDSSVGFEDAGTSPVPVTDSGSGTPTSDAASAEGGPSGGLCNADAQCSNGSGSKCIDGLCTAQGQLCSDGTQCQVAGESCVDGLCLPTCGGSAPPCPAGYACDFNRGVCSVNPSPCSQSSQCQGGAVCVETRCVAPCGPAEAGAQCSSGQVCVNGGCIPDQQAQFTCENDGNVGALASTCDPSSICLHGDCYPTCDVDAGSCAGPGQACKSVTIPKGTYAVCATASNLGSECNPAVGNYCASTSVCIDGYCK